MLNVIRDPSAFTSRLVSLPISELRWTEVSIVDESRPSGVSCPSVAEIFTMRHPSPDPLLAATMSDFPSAVQLMAAGDPNEARP